MPREKPLPSKVELQLCVFHGAPSHHWRTAPFIFDRRRDDDKELWEEIRHVYRDELQGVWRRIFGFKKLKQIIPIEVRTPLCCGVLRIRPQICCGANESGIHMKDELQDEPPHEWLGRGATRSSRQMLTSTPLLVHPQRRPNP